VKLIRKLLASFFLLLASVSFAQEQELIDDLLKIAGDFALPAAEGAAYQSSAGWFTSAKDMEEWQLEFSVHGNVLFVPKNKQNSSVSNSDFNVLNIQGDSNARVPTAFGGGSEVSYEGEIFNQSFEFEALEGVNKEMLIHPFMQATVGLPYGTDLAVRFLPETEIDGVSFGTYGVGLKHNFNQYSKFAQPEDFQFAVIVAYSKFDVGYDFKPVNIKIAELNNIDVDANLWLFELMASRRYETFEAFGALGVTSSNFEYAMGGNGPALNRINESLVALNDTKAQFKGDIGFNFYLGNFKISSMATAGKFFNFNLGLHYRL